MQPYLFMEWKDRKMIKLKNDRKISEPKNIRKARKLI